MHFYPRPPGGGRQTENRQSIRRGRISIHALRVEGDRSHARAASVFRRFLSTPSGWRATIAQEGITLADTFLSTPSGWRATAESALVCHGAGISIHALRVEGDDQADRRCARGGGISIHALRVEGDRCDLVLQLDVHISIHALRVEGDLNSHKAFPAVVRISIHALRVEGDAGGYSAGCDARHFYPRPPGGGRRMPLTCTAAGARFLSTPSGWRATRSEILPRIFYRHISIHALRVEGDTKQIADVLAAAEFLSTPSGWRATA